MPKFSLPFDLGDTLTDAILWLLFTLFQIYSKIATFILLLFFPITKYYVNRRFASYGVEIGKDLIVHNERTFYPRVAIEGIFGFMECMMDKDCSSDDFKGVCVKIMSTRKWREMLHPLTWVYDTFNLQTKGKAWEVGKQHYDAGADIIESMLDKNLQYTCGYWATATDLDSAQLAKMDLIARKLQLKPGMRVLDIGSGYGTLAYYLAKNYGVSVVGVNISKPQVTYAENLCQGLPCTFLLCDYRSIDEQFDRIVSVGMFEHVGGKNYSTFFKLCHKCLVDDGIFLLHTIGSLHKCNTSVDPWSHKYIFRNGYVPYYLDLCKALENLWVIEDWHNFGHDYSKTLAAWEKNFDREWPRFGKLYGERFHTTWKMYLQAAQAIFSTRSLSLWQIVLTKDGLKGGYHAPR